MVYSRLFASKAVFLAILNEFEFAVDCSIYKNVYGTVNGELDNSLLYTTGKVIQRLFIIDL